ncbi:unnamed protein product, partial [Ixodes persulcatus]
RREQRTLRRERLRVRRRITWNQWFSMCLASVTVVALSAYALKTAIRCGFVKWSDIKHALKFCETFDCCKIADEMVAAMDLSGDPCDDFYRYACGKATNNSLISANRDKTGYRIVLEKVRNLFANWALQEKDHNPLQKSAALYQDCLAVTKDTMRNADQLVAFLRSRSIDLAQLDSDADPLDVVLDLELFKDINSKALIQYIYWEVIRQLGPFADFRLRAPDEVLQETTDRCFRAVFSVSGLPALAAVVAENVTSEGIVSTVSFLTRLLGRTGVNVTVSIVHPHQLFAEFHARQGAEDTKKVDRLFLKAYLTALREFRQNNFDSIDALEATNPAIEDLLGHRVVYDGERLLVPTSLLAAFWFLPTTTRSFTYASLGYEVLLELSRTGAINLTSNVYCKSSANPNVDLRCLDALWELFENDDGQWSRLRLPAGVNKLSEEQLLFLVLCQKKCSTQDAEECNFPLRTWPQFAKAFQCQRGDRMSPKEDERCSGTISGSPCRDFYDYVCSGWLRNPTFRSTRDMQARTLVREASKSLKLLADSLTTPMKDPAGATSMAALKAAKLYGSCLVASKRQDIEVLGAFLRDVGLGFSTPVHAPMTLAIELDLYYNLKTLFDLHRHPTWKSADGRPVLALSKRTDLDVWLQERNGMERSKSYSDFVESRVSHVVALENSTSAKSDAAIKENVRRIIDTESVILSLWEALPSEDPGRFYKMTPLPLRDNATSWSNNVTEAAVGNPSMLAFQDSLGTRMSYRNLGLYITWEVVRHLGPLADKRLYSSNPSGTCFETVHKLMPYPTLLPYLLETLDQERSRDEAELVLKDVSDAFAALKEGRGQSSLRNS